MNFLEAVKAMKEGKKVRRSQWGKGVYLYCEESMIHHSRKHIRDTFSIFIDWFEKTDWEIIDEKSIEEKKTLSELAGEEWCKVKDVKEANKKFIDWLLSLNYCPSKYQVEQKAKEIFGDRLIKSN